MPMHAAPRKQNIFLQITLWRHNSEGRYVNRSHSPLHQKMGRGWGWGRLWLALGASLCLMCIAGQTPAQAHALPVSYSPAQNAALATPPTQAQITFLEHLNPDISRIVVVNPSNQEVDNKDSQVSGDGVTMTVTLPLLPAGTYVVAWRTHSADDGHVAAGSYIFHIKRADGTVPPLTGKLPSGTFVGAAGAPTSGIDGPNLTAALAHWFGLLALTVVLGLLCWWALVLPRLNLAPAFQATYSARARRVSDWAYLAICVGAVIEVEAQALILDGTPRGLISWHFISDILFSSRYGEFTLLRVALALLGLIVGPALWAMPRSRNRALAATLLGLALAIAFVFSGHGGAAPGWWGPPVDALHVLANGVWLGGLFALVLVLLPALAAADQTVRARFFAHGLPTFGTLAVLAVACLAITGPLNASERMTSFSQLWTTAYGIVLSVKILFFCGMIAISYYHAFRLRPRLSQVLGPTASGIAAPAMGTASASQRAFDWLTARVQAFERWQFAAFTSGGATAQLTAATTRTAPRKAGTQQRKQLTPDSDHLMERITRWLRAEAGLGVVVLLCAAMLSPLAATLAAPVTSSFGASGGAQTLTQTVDHLTVTLNVDPGKFGTNTFTVTVKNPDGTMANGGSVFLLTTMVEMDMGTNTIDLTANPTVGNYTGQGDLPMAGHWNVTVVIRTLQDPKNLHRTTFTVAVGF